MPDLSAELDKERHSVSFDSYDITVRQLLDMVASDSIDIAPEYQRQFVWDEQRQSTFIESVFLGIPIPSLFMATNKDATWELVDGVQRISSLINFCGTDELRKKIGRKSPLVLQDLEKLPSFNEQSYEDLPKSLQLAFQLRPIRVTTLNDKSDLKVRFDLFERLNTGGVRLQPQEIRNCIYRGPFNQLLKSLAQSAEFKKSVKVKNSSENDGTREELVLRFFAFLERYSDFDHSVNDFLNDYMGDYNDKYPSKEAQQRFKETFEFIGKQLPHGIVRGNRTSVTPVNLFEAIAVGTALIFRAKKQPKSGVLKRLLNDAEMRKLTTGGTNSRKMVVGRIEYVRDRLL
jgi:hypothetical protein